MRPPLPRLLALIAWATASLAQAEPTELDATLGLPRISQSQGQSLAWRELRLRVDQEAFSLEARLPSCMAQGSDTPGRTCATGDGQHSTQALSRELRAAWQGQPLWDQGPAWLLTGLAWHSPGSAEHSADRGTQAELELNQALGDWQLWLGRSHPLRSALPDERWRSHFGGLEWTSAQGDRVELSWDSARNSVTGERDRTALLSWRMDVAPATRARLQWVRQWDDSASPWRLSVGLDWRF